MNFTILEDRRHENRLQCPECNCIFMVNAYTGENLVWDYQMLMDVAKCPDCNVEQG